MTFVATAASPASASHAATGLVAPSAAFTSLAFGAWLLVAGAALVALPPALYPLFGVDAGHAAWVRVAGLFAGVIGAYDVAAARARCRPLVVLSVVTRAAALPAFAALVLWAGAPAVLIAFGLVDAAAAAWTAWALPREAISR